MSSTSSNVQHYTGYIVDKLPNDPKVGVYFCRGKLKKWIPHKWISIEVPSRFIFNDLETGKSHSFGARSKSKRHCKPVRHTPNPCAETPGTECDVDVIVRVTILTDDERIIRIPVVGRCPKISIFSEIRPIAIEGGFFVLDVSSLPDGAAVVLTYKSVGSILFVNHIIERRRIVTPAPTFF